MRLVLKYIGAGLDAKITLIVDVKTTGSDVGSLYNYFNTILERLTTEDHKDGQTLAKAIYRLVDEEKGKFKVDSISTEIKFDNGAIELIMDKKDIKE